MNFIEYESYFGVAPKVPDTPNAKLWVFKPRPQDDPNDIPELRLENSSVGNPQIEINNQNIEAENYIYVIPEVDSSSANSIGLQSPRHLG